MTRTIRALAVGLTSVALLACSSATTQNRAPRGSPNTLTSEQLSSANSDNLFDAINKLRPEWLTSRGPASVTDATPTGADVYMDGNILGKADILRGVRLQDITTVKYWDAGQASARFGMGHPRGVIEITRK